MLSFFRRYEKTFLLLIFVPALLTLGISTAMLDVLGSPGDQVVGTVFGEEVTHSEFSKVADPYRRVNQYADDDMLWKFYTLYRAAQRAGLHVSDAEVGDRLVNEKRFDIARHLTEKELAAEGIFQGSPEYREQMGQRLMKYMGTDLKFDKALYREVIPSGMSVKEYEDHEKREALVGRYLEALRETAAVTPDDVWKGYQEQNHRRVAELVVVDAKAHVPDVAVVDSDDARLVTKEQVATYFETHEQDYEEPRRVKLEALGVALDDLQVDAPSAEDATAYLDLRRNDVAGVGSQTTFDELTDVQREQVYDMLEDERRLERADAVMSAVADQVADAEAAGKTPDLAAIGAAVKEATGVALKHETTELVERQAVLDHAVVGSPAAALWFDKDHEASDVSDVFAGPKGWFVLRAVEVKHKRNPTFDEVEDRVRADYATGSSAERKRYYEEHKTSKFAGEPSWKLEALVANEADYVKEGDAEGAASARAKKALETFLGHASGARDFPLNRVFTFEDVENAGSIKHEKVETALSRSELEAHELFANMAEIVGSYERGRLSAEPIARKDGKGWVVFRVTELVAPGTKPFEQVEAAVAEAVAQQRATDRAQAWAESLSADLQGASADEAKALLAKKGLTARRTEPFGRTATSLEGFPDAGRIVAAAFEAEMKVGGPFSRVIDLPTHPDGARVVLMRVVEKVDAAQDEFAKSYATLRADVLRKVRSDYATAEMRRTFLEAKGIGAEHLKYATALRDGPGGATRLRVRQLFVPPDRSVVDAWLKEKALERMALAQADLDAGKSWEATVDKFSEDEVTRVRRGELPPVQRGQLVEDFGGDFEERAFELREGAVSRPLESLRGWHLVKRLGEREGRTVFSHLLIKVDAESRKLPQEIRDKAEQTSKARVEEAQAKLASGAPFAEVAESYGDVKDPNGQGQVFEMDYVTAFERAAFAQPLEWETVEGSPEAKDLAWLPAPVELKTGENGQPEWHLFACSRDQYDRGMPGDTSVRRDRQVFHIATPTKEAMDRVVARLRSFLADKAEDEEDRASWGAIIEEFRATARDASRAPDAAKGGAVGVLQLEGDVRAYGEAFFDGVCRKPDGSVVTAGHRSPVIRSDKGFHVVEVVEVITADEKRQEQVADALLRGTDWR